MRITMIILCLSLLSCLSSDDREKKQEQEEESAKGGFRNSEMYDFNKPFKVNLPAELDEISGIVYYPKDTSVFAIIDEDGIMYKVPIMRPKETKKWVFDEARDFEDLVLIDSNFYALVSKGDVIKVTFDQEKVTSEKLNLTTGGKSENEFEAMFLMPDSNKIVIVCKECDADKKSQVSMFSFNAKDSVPKLDTFKVLPMEPVATALNEAKLHLKASAAAIHPTTGEIYVISSVSKAIIIYDKNWELKRVFKLDPKLYKQPEGIAFTPDGDLIISNEVFLEGYGELLIMKNKLKKK